MLEVEVLELGDGHGHMESDVAEVDQVRRRLGPGRAGPAGLPDALVLDGRVLRDAPVDSTLGGIGDLVMIAVAFGDWRLGAELGLSTYPPASYAVLADVRDQLFSPGRRPMPSAPSAGGQPRLPVRVGTIVCAVAWCRLLEGLDPGRVERVAELVQPPEAVIQSLARIGVGASRSCPVGPRFPTGLASTFTLAFFPLGR